MTARPSKPRPAAPGPVARRRVLLGDIGGTNARFALLDGDTLGPIEHFAVAAHRDLDSVTAAFLATQSNRLPVDAAVFGVAGPVEGGRCEITNSRWHVDATTLAARFGFAEVRLLNDFEATAWSLPKLTAADVRQIGGGTALADAPMVVLGPGTGLGIAALVPYGGNHIVVPTEGGHADLPGSSPREDAIIACLRQKFGHVSAERALSGPGLENLYEAIASLGQEAPVRRASGITAAALDGTCPTSRAALDAFCAFLGTVAGDLALVFRARGGVYLAGGIVPQIVAHLERSEFRARFAAKGRFQPYVDAIPTSVILHPDPAFLGLRCLAERAFAGAPTAPRTARD